MEHNVKVSMLSSALVLGAAVVVSAVTSVWVASRAYQERGREGREAGQTIVVKGSSRQRITSDLANWRIVVRGEGKDLPGTYDALAAGAARVERFLTEQGFAPGAWTLGAIETTTFFARDEKGNSTREVTGYALSRDFSLETPDVARVAKAAGEVTTLIKEGVLVFSGTPQFYYSKLPDMRVAILGEASRDARVRAEEVAKNAGSVVGEVRGAQMGPLQVVRPNSTEVSYGGVYDTGTIEKDVTAVVTVTFAIRGG